VYVDVHKAIRRLTPAPRARRQAAHAAEATAAKKINDAAILQDIAEDLNSGSGELTVGSLGAHSDNGMISHPPKTAVFMKRRSSAGPDGVLNPQEPVPIKASLEEMKRQLRLQPANSASNPRHMTKSLFKIKQGLGPSTSEGRPSMVRPVSIAGPLGPRQTDNEQQDESTPLLGKVASNGNRAD
jgi:metal transporter CNNM